MINDNCKYRSNISKVISHLSTYLVIFHFCRAKHKEFSIVRFSIQDFGFVKYVVICSYFHDQHQF